MNKTDITTDSVEERLRDGRVVTIRAIHRADKGEVADAIRELSSESFYRRTFAPKRDLTEQELFRLTDVDFGNVVALVVIAIM
jgi:ABC-type ATPase with predicted acetyltransferase domain